MTRATTRLELERWLAGATCRGADETWVTVDLKTILRAARREPFTRTARVLKMGRRLVYAVAECVCGGATLLTPYPAASAHPRGSGGSLSTARTSCADNLR